MAKIKAEFLVHYYAENGLPIFNRLMSLLPDLNALLYRTAKLTGLPLPNLVNWSIGYADCQTAVERNRRASGAQAAELCGGDLCRVVWEAGASDQ